MEAFQRKGTLVVVEMGAPGAGLPMRRGADGALGFRGENLGGGVGAYGRLRGSGPARAPKNSAASAGEVATEEPDLELLNLPRLSRSS